MKTKIPILIAAGLLIATLTQAQYSGEYAGNRVDVYGQVTIPGHIVIGYGYNTLEPLGYQEQRNCRRDDDGFSREYREDMGDDYEHYYRKPREHRKHRGDRGEFYHDYDGYRVVPVYAPKRVVVYGY